MILIADSGSTKTDWCTEDAHIIHTSGINPVHQSENTIQQIIEKELLTQLPKEVPCEAIHFYGAGCTPEKSLIIKQVLSQYFPKATIEVNSDLLGAARALCGSDTGIACILGTGSNSCYYDGNRIVANVSPLGYILGDEGSGAVLGKRLISDCLKNQLPHDICQTFLTTCHLTPADIIERVYRQPQANRFLASLTPFLSEHRNIPEIQQLLISSFTEFFRRNVMQYAYEDTEVHFTGSIAWYFQEEVKVAAKGLGIKTGVFIKNPIEKLLEFHLPKY